MGSLPDILFSVALGLGLAAACGLRVFLPLFVASAFAHFDVGGVGLREGFGWLSEWPAMIALGVATIAELLAYYLPWWTTPWMLWPCRSPRLLVVL